jgi:glycosyltransferase involved in cell wall biosynthesis
MPRGARVDIVVPVYNEARVLAASIGTLVEFLSQECPYDWRVVIADNASTDETPAIMWDLARRYSRVQGMRVETKGRGIALKRAWIGSDAPIHAYMDVDLSTDLSALKPLLDCVAGGHDIAIGSRHVPRAVLRRSVKREVLSRAYNRLLRLLFGTSVTDAQCGFKAVSHRVVTDLVPRVESDGWFFDTELLLLAEHAGYRIAQVPVRWVEDRDSRVQVGRTVAEYLREAWRLRRTVWGSAEPARARARFGTVPTPDSPAAGSSSAGEL